MNSRLSQVLELFSGGYNCCQSILTPYSDFYGLDRNLALKLASGMGGGVGHGGDLCGFVSGACMILGLKSGTTGTVPEKKFEMCGICLDFCNDFKEKYGSLNCRDIIKCDIRIQEDCIKAKESGKMNICGECAQMVVNLLETKYGVLNP